MSIESRHRSSSPSSSSSASQPEEGAAPGRPFSVPAGYLQNYGIGGGGVIQRKADPSAGGGGGGGNCSWPGVSGPSPAGKQAEGEAASAQATPIARQGEQPLPAAMSFLGSRFGATQGGGGDAPPPPPGGATATGGTAPATGGTAPATGGTAPATSGAAPATGGSAPATTTAPATTGATGTTGATPAPGGAAPASDADQRRAIAEAMINIRGTAQASDGALVVTELVKFELRALQALQARGVKMAVCRGSVTDYLTSLRGVAPRGWPPGMTWDTVPGTYWAPTNEIVIAVVGSGTGVHVPRAGEGHGSYNVVIHESTHGIDRNRAPGVLGSSDPAFQTARNADLAGLPAYEKQAGVAGLEETYAESAARYFGGDPTDATAHPNLHAYWASHPLPAQGSP